MQGFLIQIDIRYSIDLIPRKTFRTRGGNWKGTGRGLEGNWERERELEKTPHFVPAEEREVQKHRMFSRARERGLEKHSIFNHAQELEKHSMWEDLCKGLLKIHGAFRHPFF